MGRLGLIFVCWAAGLAAVPASDPGVKNGAAVQAADPTATRARDLLREWRTALRQAEKTGDWVRADSLARAATGAAHALNRSLGCGRPCVRQTEPRP